MATSHVKLNEGVRAGADQVERHLAALERAYQRALRAAGFRAARAFQAAAHTASVTAAADPKWTPPPVGQVFDSQQLADDTEQKTAKLHRTILETAGSAALEPFGIAFDVTAPVPQALLAQVGKRVQDGIADAIQAQIVDAIQTGYAEGHSVATVAAAIRTATSEIAKPRAQMLARTDLVALSNGGSLAAASLAGAAPFKTWLCVTGDTRVAGRPVRVARRLHAGELVRITAIPASRTSNPGPTHSQLSVTPDHPVLTNRGWVAAQFLEPGDGIFGCPALDIQSVMEPDIKDVPATIAEVFDAAADAGTCERMVGLVVQFNGKRERGEVEVVSVDGELRDRFDSELAKPDAELLFSLSDVGLEETLSKRGPVSVSVGQRDSDSSDRAFAGVSKGSLAVMDPPIHSRLGMAADGHASDPERPYDRRLVDTEAPRETSLGFSGLVAPYEVVGVEIIPWRGHVYDLETESGWFVANGIIVHNSAEDERVRETHAEADGQTVPIDAPFTVGGEEAQFPGSPELSDEEACNCRCTITYSDSLAAAAPAAAAPPLTSDGAARALLAELSESRAAAARAQERTFDMLGRMLEASSAPPQAPSVHVYVPEQPPSVVNVTVPEREVVVNVPEQASPVVHVAAAPPPDVHVHVPEQPAPVVAAAPAPVTAVRVEVDKRGTKTYIPVRDP